MFKNIEESILYKYRPIESIEQILRTLRYGELWFSSAKLFNDPFDTALTYNFDGIHTELAERWMNSAAEKFSSELPTEGKAQFIAKRLHQIRTDPNEINKMRQMCIDQNYDSFGIYSLSSLKDSILMWGHYCRSHTGVCIGLNVPHLWEIANKLVKFEEIINLVKIHYSVLQPNINFYEAMLNSDKGHIMQFVCTKSIHWSYENEFRLINWNYPNKAIVFGPEVISEVIFGLRTSPELKEVIHLHCREYNPKVQFFQTIKDKGEFKINLEPII